MLANRLRRPAAGRPSRLGVWFGISRSETPTLARLTSRPPS